MYRAPNFQGVPSHSITTNQVPESWIKPLQNASVFFTIIAFICFYSCVCRDPLHALIGKIRRRFRDEDAETASPNARTRTNTTVVLTTVAAGNENMGYDDSPPCYDQIMKNDMARNDSVTELPTYEQATNSRTAPVEQPTTIDAPAGSGVAH